MCKRGGGGGGEGGARVYRPPWPAPLIGGKILTGAMEMFCPPGQPHFKKG